MTHPDASDVDFPMSPNWPLELHNTITLAEQDGKTVLTLLSQPNRRSKSVREGCGVVSTGGRNDKLL
ncbi:hypothetical protein [Massilia psychrophila]|jgi:hypothetical protein|uniref:Uncharacterized protein n=1 Tax=Massilia psychrophila TaxID=1603353 RepID=A0A2G8SXP2_9BURK|nr:hypothetical protein [Massilia psychrophila]PIL38483.1 hypothetical protein CR103_17825 [Massilia psychrophila]GGE89373.1 hypothetical protein GCM10008020_38020 [Massilia psychrophila]